MPSISPVARAARMSPMCSFTQDRLPCRVSIRLVGARSSWEMITMGWVRHRVIINFNSPGPWPRACQDLLQPPSSHPQIDSLFFILPLLDLSSIPRAREGGPWGLPAAKLLRRSSCQWSQASFFAFFLCFCASSSFFKIFLQNCSFTKVLALRGAHFLP